MAMIWRARRPVYLSPLVAATSGADTPARPQIISAEAPPPEAGSGFYSHTRLHADRVAPGPPAQARAEEPAPFAGSALYSHAAVHADLVAPPRPTLARAEEPRPAEGSAAYGHAALSNDTTAPPPYRVQVVVAEERRPEVNPAVVGKPPVPPPVTDVPGLVRLVPGYGPPVDEGSATYRHAALHADRVAPAVARLARAEEPRPSEGTVAYRRGHAEPPDRGPGVVRVVSAEAPAPPPGSVQYLRGKVEPPPFDGMGFTQRMARAEEPRPEDGRVLVLGSRIFITETPPCPYRPGRPDEGQGRRGRTDEGQGRRGRPDETGTRRTATDTCRR